MKMKMDLTSCHGGGGIKGPFQRWRWWPATYLPLLVSTVPSESCFSSANRILSDKRSKLGPHVFERLVCLKDWIQAEERRQHVPEASSSEVDTEESGTEARHQANSDSDGAEESEEWYRNENF